MAALFYGGAMRGADGWPNSAIGLETVNRCKSIRIFIGSYFLYAHRHYRLGKDGWPRWLGNWVSRRLWGKVLPRIYSAIWGTQSLGRILGQPKESAAWLRMRGYAGVVSHANWE